MFMTLYQVALMYQNHMFKCFIGVVIQQCSVANDLEGSLYILPFVFSIIHVICSNWNRNQVCLHVKVYSD
jgi:hypothetical protein